MFRSQLVAVAIAITVVSSACGADPDDSLSAPTTTVAQSEVTYPANGEQAAVTALDNNFVPQQINVKAGTEVVFTNNGRNPHNVLPADDPTAASWGALEADFMPKDVYAHVFDRPGTYVFYCSIHGTPTAAMYGTINVTEP